MVYVCYLLCGLFSLLMVGAMWTDCQAEVSKPAYPGFSPDPVQRRADTTVQDLLRGFTDDELNAANEAFPKRLEPDLAEPVSREVKVSGCVFIDTNANGEMDADERGLDAVMVTDGETVIRTDSNGRFAFSFEMDEEPHYRFVVATRPTGYKPTNSYFLRIPFAEDRTEYQANFGFVEDALSRREDFWFISTSDSQFTQPAQMIVIAKDYAQMTDVPGNPAFLMTVGDLTMNGTQYEWDMYDAIRGSSRLLVYDCFGGHDGNCLKPRSVTNYELRIGPSYYSWDYGGVHFVLFVTETAYLHPKAKARHQAWLKADLEAIPAGTPVIAVTHYPLPGEWFDQRRAEGINVICQLAGHWHVVQAGSRGGVPVLITAPARGRDWGAFSRTYRWVHVTRDGVRSDLRVAGQYRRLEMLAPCQTAPLERQPLVVLAYDSTSKVQAVTYRITAPDGNTMKQKLTQQGDWSWQGAFVPHIAGEWQFELGATDITGEEWQHKQTVRVTSKQLAQPEPDADFSWLLDGTPPRRLPGGPGAPLYPIWVRHTNSIHVLHNSPVVADGRVYVAVCNPNAGAPGSGVLCLDARTGRELWRANSPLGDFRGTVTVHDGRVYALSGEGWIACFDARTGAHVWSKPLQEAYRLGRPAAMIQTPPVPTKHGLLVSDWQAPQFLLNYTTGDQLARLEGNVGSYVAFATVFDDIMYCARRGGAVALKVPTGEVVWQAEENARSTSAGIVVDGKFLYTASSSVKAVDSATGKGIWHTGVANVGHKQPVPVVWDDLVLVNGTDFTAVDLTTGAIRWTVTCADEPVWFERSQRQSMSGVSTPIVAGELAYFGHDDGSVRAVDRIGNIVWQYRLGTPIKTSLAVSGNLLFIHDYAGNLWCFAPAAGK